MKQFLFILFICIATVAIAQENTNTDETVYTIQLGVFKTLRPKNTFSNIKNIEILRTNDSLYRYVSGSFSTLKEATAYKNDLQQKKYPNAFIYKYKKQKNAAADTQAALTNLITEKDTVGSGNAQEPSVVVHSDSAITPPQGKTTIEKDTSSITIAQMDSLFKQDPLSDTIPASTASQEIELNCITFVKTAEGLFNAGDYVSCINLLERGLNECSLSMDEKEAAITELIKAYLETDNLGMTDVYTKKLLKNNPNYELKKDLVQPDFVRLYNSYRIRPLLTAGIKAGLNFPIFNVAKTYSVYDSVDYEAPYKSRTGYQFGVSGEVEPIRNIAVCADINYAAIKYERSIDGVKGWNLNYKEKMSEFEAAGYLKIYFTKKRLKPYIIAGAYVSRLSDAVANVSLTYKTIDRLTLQLDEYSISQNNISQNNQRTIFNNGVLVGLGARYKISNILIGAEAYYSVGLTNLADGDRRYSNSDLLYNYYYVDNDFKVNKIMVSVTASYILKYSVKKKKNG